MWTPVDDAQPAIWQPVNSTQESVWLPVNDAQTEVWVTIYPADQQIAQGIPDFVGIEALFDQIINTDLPQALGL